MTLRKKVPGEFVVFLPLPSSPVCVSEVMFPGLPAG